MRGSVRVTMSGLACDRIALKAVWAALHFVVSEHLKEDKSTPDIH